MSKLVRDLMHPGLITCRPDTPLGQVAVLLDHHHVHALFVADRDGRPLGVISDFDLLAAEWLSTDRESLETMKKMTAGELMTHPINSIEADVEYCDAAARMQAENISRLMVTEKGSPGRRGLHFGFRRQPGGNGQHRPPQRGRRHVGFDARLP